MSGFSEDQEIVLEIIKLWLRKKDASFLAREELVVFWGPLDGNLRKQDWNKLKLSEAVSIIRSTEVPVGVMKHCTADIFRAAAQEEARTYVAGVSVVGGAVSPEYFNYNSKKRSACETIEHQVAVHLISELEALQQNIMWTDVAYLFEQCLKYMKIEIPNSMQRNKFIRYGLNDSAFIEKRNSKRYNGRYVIRENGKLRQLICIKLPDRSGIKSDWTLEEKRGIVLRSVTPLLNPPRGSSQ